MSFFNSIDNLRRILRGPSLVYSIKREQLPPPLWKVIDDGNVDGNPEGHVSVRLADDNEWATWHAYYNKGYPGKSEYEQTLIDHQATLYLQASAQLEGTVSP